MSKDSSRPFEATARLYWQKGLSVVPIEPNSKRPARELKGWQGLMNGPPSLARQSEWLARYPERGLGVLTGTEIAAGQRLGAVDVDQDEFIKVVEVILCQS
jgi:hypothetical protein